MTTRFSVKITSDFNKRKFKHLREQVKQNAHKHVSVGVPEGPVHDFSGVPLSLLAAVHEYGSPSKNIPERPFIGPAIQKSVPRLRELNKINLLKIAQGTLTIDQALGQMGLLLQGAAQAELLNGAHAPLKPATIEAKGSSRPLYDFGNLVQSITYVIKSDNPPGGAA